MSFTTATEVKTERGEFPDLVDNLISAARDVEWQSHFGSNWDGSREHMLALRARVLAVLERYQTPKGHPHV